LTICYARIFLFFILDLLFNYLYDEIIRTPKITKT